MIGLSYGVDPAAEQRAESDSAARESDSRGGDPGAGVREPRVWVVADDRPGNTTQSLGLAECLGWPYEIKTLHCSFASSLHNRLLAASLRGIDRRRSSPLEAPWPDLVIAAGRRTAPVALWIREQNQGRTRLVELGRKGGDAAELFDLSVIPEYGRLLPHPNRLVIRAPLHRITPELLEEASEQWRDALCEAGPAPQIALLVGGSSGQYWLAAETAHKMGEAVAEMARRAGGSVVATTSRRTGAKATKALAAGLGRVVHFYDWKPGDSEGNPYRGYLALADAFVITGDSESILAEACSTGKPVYVYPLPVRPSFRLLRLFRETVVHIAQAGSGRYRDPSQQGFFEALCAWLIARGFVRPTRDLDLLHESLVEEGALRRFGAPYSPSDRPPLREVEQVAQRVRSLMSANES
jgi:mitochondrial fission protein ELM1